MTFRYNAKNIDEELRQHEIEELLDYCNEQGFSEEQTEIFVKNSLARIYPDE